MRGATRDSLFADAGRRVAILGTWKSACCTSTLAVFCLLASACDRKPDEANRLADSVAESLADAPAAAAPEKVAVAEPSCAGALRAEADGESFSRGPDAGPSATAEQIETLRAAAERQFRTVAEGMCGSGRLSAKDLGPWRRLLVQNGAGADNVAIYADPEAFGRETLVFQYVFDQGGEAAALALPSDGDLRSGLICWSRPDEHETMCRGREP